MKRWLMLSCLMSLSAATAGAFEYRLAPNQVVEVKEIVFSQNDDSLRSLKVACDGGELVHRDLESADRILSMGQMTTVVTNVPGYGVQALVLDCKE